MFFFVEETLEACTGIPPKKIVMLKYGDYMRIALWFKLKAIKISPKYIFRPCQKHLKNVSTGLVKR